MTPQSTEHVTLFMSYGSSKTGTFETNNSRKMHFKNSIYIVLYSFCFMEQAATSEKNSLSKASHISKCSFIMCRFKKHFSYSIVVSNFSFLQNYKCAISVLFSDSVTYDYC